MIKALQYINVRFAYRGTKVPALDDVNFSVDEGEFVGIVGHTGAGKSSLVRCATGIVPKFFKGPYSGDVQVFGKSIAKKKVAQMAGQVGIVFQDFESQLFSTNARLECAFGMENLGIDRETMLKRIGWAEKLAGLTGLMDREPQTLSGGQKQRLALASVLCLDPKLLLCDEPTTDLDPVGKSELLSALRRFADTGKSIVLVEHEIQALLFVDRIAVMNKGKIIAQGSPNEVLADPDFCRQNGLHPPQLFDLFARLDLAQRPLRVKHAKENLDQEGFAIRSNYVLPKIPKPSGDPMLVLDNVSFSYDPEHPVLQDISLEIKEGEFLAVLGQNGSGKTTLVKHFNALLHPSSGSVQFQGESVPDIGIAQMGRKVGFVYQNPDYMLFAANVFDEVAFGLRNYKVPEEQIPEKVAKALAIVGLEGKEKTDPFIMTKGERQKLAVACVLACEPQMLILDEPTTGLDATEQIAMMDLLVQLNQKGHTIVIITHSVDVAAAYAQRTVLLSDGRIIADGLTRDVFTQPELLEKSKLVAPPIVRLGSLFGVKVVKVSELVDALVRRPQ